MTYINYETLKKKIASNLYTSIITCADGKAAAYALMDSMAEKRPFKTSLQEFADKAYDIVMRWDVRLVGKLRELFPGEFPAALRTGPLVAEYGESGNWIVRAR